MPRIPLVVRYRQYDITSACRLAVLDRPSGWRAVQLPPGGSEFVIDLPDDATHFSLLVAGPRELWEANGHFVHRGGGAIALLVPQPELEIAGRPGRIVAHLSMLRDATGGVLHQLKHPSARSGPVTAWKFDDLRGASYLRRDWSPPRAGKAARACLPQPQRCMPDCPPPDPYSMRGAFGPRTGRFGTTDAVLEIKPLPMPRLFGVSWPDAIPTTQPVPMLLHFRPTMNQADRKKPHYDTPDDPYPFGTAGDPARGKPRRTTQYLDSLLLEFSRSGDPLRGGVYAVGLPAQIAAAGKAAVLVVPLGKEHGEMGTQFLSRGVGAFILDEIIDFMCRLKRQFAPPPALGRLAISAFSSGHSLMRVLLEANAGTPLYVDKLSELYLFDPLGAQNLDPMHTAAGLWRHARKQRPGAARDNRDRIIRYYGQVPVGPFPDDDPVYTTRALICPCDWFTAGTVCDAHHLFPANMLTHAMRESLFPAGELAPASARVPPAARLRPAALHRA